MDVTLPFEAFDPEHPDHNWWVSQTGKCLAEDCPDHKKVED